LKLQPLLRAEVTLAPPLEIGQARIARRLAAGEPVDPSLYYMRTTPRFETAAPRYAWLNRTICVAAGARLAAAAELEVFEIQ
jgi:hypothetical protein